MAAIHYNPTERILILLVIFFSLIHCRVHAGSLQPEPDSLRGIDSAYIADYKNLLTARLFLLYQDASFVLSPQTSKEIVYTPNVSGRIGIAGFYKWFGLGLSLGNSVFRRSANRYGNTSVLDLRVNAYGRVLAGEFYVQNLKGFYIRNLKDPDGNFYKIPDMRIFSVGITGYWIYNHDRFSIRSAFIQNERQKKSAGSFIIRGTFLYYDLSSGSGILPAGLITSYSINNQFFIREGEFWSYGLAPGYSYSLIFLKNFYLNAGVFPGVLLQHYQYQAQQSYYTSADFTFTLSWRAAIGYNTDSWYVGAGIVSGFDKVPGWTGNSTFYYDIAQMRVWAGTRFAWFRKKK